VNAIKSGNLALIKWLIEDKNISINGDIVVESEYVSNAEEVLEYILDKIDSHHLYILYSNRIDLIKLYYQILKNRNKWYNSFYNILIINLVHGKDDGHLTEWICDQAYNDGYGIDYEYNIYHQCRSDHIDSAKTLYKCAKKYNSVINDVNALNARAFKNACDGGRSDIAQWLLGLSGVDGNSVISEKHVIDYDDSLFRNACKMNWFDIVDILCSICPDYSYRIENKEKIVPIIKDMRTILKSAINANDFNELKCLKMDGGKTDSDILCPLCLSDEPDKWVKIDCGHTICANCYICIDKCPFGCKTNVRRGHLMQKSG
jgi:hypothetical protein